MPMKDQQAIAELYESVLQLTYQNVNKNLFYGLKSLLDQADDFQMLSDKNIVHDNQQSMSVQFVYKGTRTIRVFVGVWFNNQDIDSIRNMTVTVFETTPEGKTIEKLDTNAFYNPEDKQNHQIGHDPSIRTVEEFVEYVRSVLDRSDNDGNDEYVQPVAPAPKAKTQPKVFA